MDKGLGRKRKRSETDPSARLRGKIHHYIKDLRKAAKKAKGFEIQRLVKRMRDTRKRRDDEKTPVDVDELGAQLETLKKIDLERIVEIALASKIRKDKLLFSNDVILAILDSPPFSVVEKSTDPQTQKIENKLLSSPVMATETIAAVNALKKALNLEPVKEKTMGTEGESGESGGEEDEDEWTGINPMEVASNVSRGDLPSREEFSDHSEERLVEVAGWESGSLDDDVEEGIHSESGISVSSGPPRKKSQIAPSKKDEESLENEASSKFLPSLSMGYVRGDSDSEFNSEEENPTKERKNRRGQRARQAIWAQKYGKNAKHIKKEQQKPASTTFKPSARSERGGKGNSQYFEHPIASRSFASSQVKPVASQGPLHPSWEAKRKLKSKENGQILPPQGKKIVFS